MIAYAHPADRGKFLPVRLLGDAAAAREEGVLFFENKNQKTFAHSMTRGARLGDKGTSRAPISPACAPPPG
jgi:hypothetical protein